MCNLMELVSINSFVQDCLHIRKEAAESEVATLLAILTWQVVLVGFCHQR